MQGWPGGEGIRVSCNKDSVGEKNWLLANSVQAALPVNLGHPSMSESGDGKRGLELVLAKLQALVYDILPSFESTETELFSLPGVDASHVYVRALALGCFYSQISTGTFRKALTASVDSCAEIKSAPSVV